MKAKITLFDSNGYPAAEIVMWENDCVTIDCRGPYIQRCEMLRSALLSTLVSQK
jgi:hypothetical protein